MAYNSFEDFGDEGGDDAYDLGAEHDAGSAGGRRRVKRLTNGFGALVSVVLVIGVAVWGYKIAVRAAHGVPVIHAAEGPMRIAPADPGGEKMAHQGLAVNSVAAVGEVAAPAIRLTLAPKPVELSDLDVAGFAPTPLSAVVPNLAKTIPLPGKMPEEGSSTDAMEGDLAAIDSEPETETGAVMIAVPEVATVLAPAAQFPVTASAVAVAPGAGVIVAAEIVAPAPLLTGAVPTAVENAVALAMAEVAAAEPVSAPAVAVASSKTAVAVSLRPALRPNRAVAPEAVVVQASVATEGAAAPVVTTFDPAKLVAGTRLVQLGAFDDEQQATRAWDTLHTQFASYFDGKDRVIQQATSGGRTFFRLRAHGFADEDEARRFCAVLLNDQAACIPVLVR